MEIVEIRFLYINHIINIYITHCYCLDIKGSLNMFEHLATSWWCYHGKVVEPFRR